MSRFSWLRSLRKRFASSGRARPRPARPPRKSPPPFLEQLEVRCLPATITWNNSAGGSWQTAGNWDLNRVPTAGDDVVIPNLGGLTYTVTYASATTDINSLTTASPPTLSIASGQLTLHATSTTTGALNNSGRLDVEGGTLNLDGTGGTSNGAFVIGTGAAITYDGGGSSTLFGSASFTGAGDLNLRNHTLHVTGTVSTDPSFHVIFNTAVLDVGAGRRLFRHGGRLGHEPVRRDPARQRQPDQPGRPAAQPGDLGPTVRG